MTPEQVEQIEKGLTCEWYHHKQLVVYRLTDVTPKLVDHWANTILKTLKAWDKGKPYLALHDISATGVSLQYATLVSFDLMNIGGLPSNRLTAEEFFNDHPEFRARVAIGFNLTVSGQVSQAVMDRLKSGHPSIRYKTFFSREKALTWLEESLKPAENGA